MITNYEGRLKVGNNGWLRETGGGGGGGTQFMNERQERGNPGGKYDLHYKL